MSTSAPSVSILSSHTFSLFRRSQTSSIPTNGTLILLPPSHGDLSRYPVESSVGMSTHRFKEPVCRPTASEKTRTRCWSLFWPRLEPRCQTRTDLVHSHGCEAI